MNCFYHFLCVGIQCCWVILLRDCRPNIHSFQRNLQTPAYSQINSALQTKPNPPQWFLRSKCLTAFLLILFFCFFLFPQVFLVFNECAQRCFDYEFSIAWILNLKRIFFQNLKWWKYINCPVCLSPHTLRNVIVVFQPRERKEKKLSRVFIW